MDELKKRAAELKERTQLFAQNKLKSSVHKKMKTIMIGALASFEESFGELWGIDKEYSELSEQQKQFRDLWEKTRTEILNKGNKQVRSVGDELTEYTLEWNRHHTKFILKGQDHE